MIKAAGGGSIINLSSAAGRFGYAYRTPYSSAKWGVIGLTQSLAKELGPDNIRVNAILPGVVEGPRMTGVIRDRAAQVGVSYEEMEKTYIENISLRRMVSASDVAAAVLFLVSSRRSQHLGPIAQRLRQCRTHLTISALAFWPGFSGSGATGPPDRVMATSESSRACDVIRWPRDLPDLDVVVLRRRKAPGESYGRYLAESLALSLP